MTELSTHLRNQHEEKKWERVKRLIDGGQRDYADGILKRKTHERDDDGIPKYGLIETDKRLLNLLHKDLFYPKHTEGIHFVSTVRLKHPIYSRILELYHESIEHKENPYKDHGDLRLTPFNVFNAFLQYMSEQEEVFLATRDYDIDMLVLGEYLGFQITRKGDKIVGYDGVPLLQREIYIGDRTIHIFIYGGTGSGKSSCGERICICFYLNGEKIIDLMEEGRLEACCYPIPQKDPSLLNLLSDHNQEPRAFHTEVLLPYIVGPRITIPVKKNGLAKWQLFKIRLSDMSATDFQVFLELTRDAQDILQMALMDVHGGGINALLDIIENTREDKKILNPLIRRLKILGRYKLLVGDDYTPPNENVIVLNIDKIMRDPKYITVFNTQYLEENMRNIIYSYVLRQIYTLRQGVTYPQMRLYIRELSTLAPSQESINTRKQIVDMARKGRDRGCGLIMDSQRPQACRKDVRQEAEIKIIYNLRPSDIKALEIKDLYELEDDIPKMKVGMACISVNKEGNFYPIIVAPPVHHHKREKENVMDLYWEDGYKRQVAQEQDDFKHVKSNITNEQILMKMANSPTKYTQEQIADVLGVDQSQVSRMLNPDA